MYDILHVDKEIINKNTDSQNVKNMILKRQKYHFIGSHSAIKTCLWLKKSLYNIGECYKSKFYGISSHRCVQMTPTLACNHRCLHCWRAIEINEKIPEKWDSPQEIVENCLKEQYRLISGFNGSKFTDMEKYKEAMIPRHAAISLSGEPTLYPYLSGLIDEFHKRNITTFVVTNGTNPDILKKIKPTQLYISLNAPDKETYKKVCNHDEWDKIIESLNLLKHIKTRTAIRITLTKHVNMFDSEAFAKQILLAMPDFVELKAYMYLGFSRKRLSRNNMPEFSEIMEFSKKISEKIGYDIADYSEISRVVLLSKNGKKKSYIESTIL